jgi:hypothetical protein
MVGSTVYGFENDLTTIVALLKRLGYDVLNSHVGTIKVVPTLSNLENCLKAVEECDLFLGIIRPYYGSGNILLKKSSKRLRTKNLAGFWYTMMLL